MLSQIHTDSISETNLLILWWANVTAESLLKKRSTMIYSEGHHGGNDAYRPPVLQN